MYWCKLLYTYDFYTTKRFRTHHLPAVVAHGAVATEIEEVYTYIVVHIVSRAGNSHTAITTYKVGRL